jgi:hypothetical protein
MEHSERKTPMTTNDALGGFADLRRTLLAARQRTIRRWFLIGSGRALAAIALALGLAVALGMIWPKSWASPLGAGLLAATALVFLARELVIPLRRAPSVARYTRAIDEQFAALGERHEFLSALELGGAPAQAGVSPDLVQALVAERADAAGRLDLEAPGRRAIGRLWLAMAGGAALLLLALGLAAPGRFTQSLAALVSPQLPHTGAVAIEVLTGNLRVQQGSDVTVKARITAGKDGLVPLLHVRRGAGVWRTVGVDSGARTGGAEFAFTLPNIEADTRYRVAAGSAQSPEYLIGVIEPLRVASFQVEYRYPAYARLTNETVQSTDGAVAALKGTEVTVRFETTEPVARGTLEVSGEKPAAIVMDEPTRGEAKFVIRRAGTYALALERKSGLENPAGGRVQLGPYTITPAPDLDPMVVVVKPGQDSDVPADMRVQVSIHAADDYGLSSAALHYTHEGGKPGSVKIQGTADRPRELTATHTWDLSAVKLLPGDIVSYFVEVQDNDTVSGPKKARSRTYTLRIPTLTDLYAEVGEEHKSAAESLEEVREEGLDLKQELDRIARELTKFPDAAWEDRQEVAQAFERQEAIREQVEQLAADLGQALSRLENQNLVDEEVLAKVSEIQRMLDQIGDPELKEAFKRLSEQLAQLDPSEVQKALKDLTLTHDELLKNLERTLAMLEQVQLEEKLEQAVQQAEEIAKQQDAINEELEPLADRSPGEDKEQEKDSKEGEKGEEGKESKEDKPGDTADKQKDDQGKQGEEGKEGEQGKESEQSKEGDQGKEEQGLSRLEDEQEENQESAEELAKLLEELAQQLEKMNQQAAEQMQQLAQESGEKGDMQGSMQASMQQMQQQNAKGAKKSGQKASEEARNLLEQLRMQQQMMMNDEMAETAEKLREAARELLKVSERQESLITAGEGAEAQRSAEDQLRLLEATRRVNQLVEEISRTSIMVGTDFAGLLGQPIRSMENATSSFERSNVSGGRMHGYQALAQVNEAILALLETEESMCQAGGGSCSSMKKSMQSLGDLSSQQQQVNDGARQLMQQGGSRLSESGQARLTRLAAQQRAIQQGMESVAENLDSRREVLGNLGGLSRDMEEVAEQMQRGELDERLLSKQHQIMSRLLDAQRSVRKRDLGRERISRPGEEFAAPNGLPAVPDEMLTRRERLEADILRGRSDAYPPEFRELVERYFRALVEARAEKANDDGSAPN